MVRMWLTILGTGCILYFVWIVLYAGLEMGFTCFWLALGAGLLFLSCLTRILNKRQVIMPPIFKRWLVGLAVIGLLCFLMVEAVLIYHANKKPHPGADYMVVLGARVNGTAVSKTLKRRLDAAIHYARENGNTEIIVSGGKGTGEEDVSEAEAMKEYMVKNGINGKRIHREDQSTDTKENIWFSKALINKEKGARLALKQRIVIVSNGFHIFRATSIARKSGFREVEGLGAPTDRILMVNYYVREAIAVGKDVWKRNM